MVCQLKGHALGATAAFPMLRMLPLMQRACSGVVGMNVVDPNADAAHAAHSCEPARSDCARCAKQGSIVRDLHSLPVSVAAVAATLSPRAPRPPGQQHV